MQAESVIDIEQLSKRYGEVCALQSVSLKVERGERFGLIGPDGAGKTTLLRILTTLLDYEKGEAKVLGFSVSRESSRIRSSIGYMPQRFSLYPDLTVEENLLFFSDLFQVPKIERIRRTTELMEFSRLTPFMKRRADHLSGGMKQKLALCCALIHTPSLLILDEPTTGVDPLSRREFWEILDSLNKQGVSILLSTPYMEEASLCDRIAMIHKGQILSINTPDTIIKLFKGSVYSVVGSDLQGLARVFKKRLSRDCIQIRGDRIKIIFNLDSTLSMKTLHDWSSAEGFIIQHAEKIKPELEDVFVTLMGETTIP
jgi:ABC-2 type transport system ATP-binding protein